MVRDTGLYKTVSSVNKSIRNREMPLGHFLPYVLVSHVDGHLVVIRVMSGRHLGAKEIVQSQEKTRVPLTDVRIVHIG